MEQHDPGDQPTESIEGLADDVDSPGQTAAQRRSTLEPGATIKHYEVIRRLGGGGMGEVYLARDTRLGRLLALKILREATASDRFIAEARVTAGLAHDNIVALYDIDDHFGTPYMALEYVAGRTFKELLGERRPAPPGLDFAPLSVDRAVELIVPVLRALAHAHEAGIVHRDLKPSNIMLAPDGSVKVVDFGIAKIIGSVEPPATADTSRPFLSGSTPSATYEGEVLGSRPYMSPEQWGGAPVDHRSDLWAVGIILCEMVTGSRPFADLSLAQLRRTVIDPSSPTPSVRRQHPELGTLGEMIDRCLVKDVGQRAQSARALLDELEALRRLGATSSREPYPGLTSFQEHDAPLFRGRDQAIAELLARIAEQPLVAMIGPSGAGKSSFVRAGVIPALKRSGDRYEALIVRPGRHPLPALAELLAPESVSGAERDMAALVAKLTSEPGFFGAELRRRAREQRVSFLLFVDQTEEIYTLASANERSAFLRCLAGAADDPGSPIRTVLGLRSDFLDRLTDAPRSILDAISRNTLLLRPLDRQGLRDALVHPAAVAGHRFESEALVETILDALEHQAGALPVLQFTAARLWELRDRDRHLLTEASYRTIGGIAGALASHADAVIGSLPSTARRWARAILLRLVTPERTRAVLSRGELRELAAGAVDVDAVVTRLIDARLLTSGGSNDEHGSVELVHESLIDRWPLLGRWLDEESEDAELIARLRSAARDWEASGRSEGLLWRGEAADEATRWHKRHSLRGGAALGFREERYLRSVNELARASSRRRLLFVTTVIAVLLVAVGAVSMLAWRRTVALVESRDAMRLSAARLQAKDPTTALILLRELEGRVAPPGWAAETKRVLHAGVAQVHHITRHVEGVAFSPDGLRFAASTSEGSVIVKNVDGSGTSLVLPTKSHTATLWGVAYSPDGKLVASGGARTLMLWHTDGSGAATSLTVPSGVMLDTAFSPDGTLVASGWTNGVVRLTRSDGQGQPVELQTHAGKINGVAFAPDGQRIALGCEDSTVRIWTFGDTTQPPLVLKGHRNTVHHVAFTPDGRQIASASNDGTVRLWNADGSASSQVVATFAGRVWSAVVSPDGKQLAIGGENGVVTLLQLGNSSEPQQFVGPCSTVDTLAFSPDGKRLASACYDGSVRIWNARDDDAPIVLRHPIGVFGASFDSEGRRIVIADTENRLTVRNADGTGTPVVVATLDKRIAHAVFSKDGQYVWSSGVDQKVHKWRVDGSGEAAVFGGFRAPTYGIALSHDGARLAAISDSIRVWNTDGSGKPVEFAVDHNFPVGRVVFSADGSHIAAGYEHGVVEIWNSDGTGKPVVIERAGNNTYTFAFTPDSRSIAIGAGRTLELWPIDGVGPPRRLGEHENDIRELDCSPDGRHVAAIADDNVVHIWNTDGSGEAIALVGNTDAGYDLYYSADGRRILNSSVDGTLRIWRDLQPQLPDDINLWRATNECLSTERRQQLLAVSPDIAARLYERCEKRVAEARR